MAGENVGLDLASQTGQANIVTAIEDLANTGGLANQVGQANIVTAIDLLTSALLNFTSVDNAMSGSSSNPVQNSVIKSYIDSKTNVIGHPYGFSQSRDYAVGDFCIHDDTIYCCTSTVTAGSEFDSTKWESVSIWDLVIGITVNFGTVSALPQTFSVPGMLPCYEIDRVELGTISALTSGLSANTDTPNQVTLSGSIASDSSTTIKIKFSASKPITASVVSN